MLTAVLDTEGMRRLYVDGRMVLAVARELLDDDSAVDALVAKGYALFFFELKWRPGFVHGEVAAIPPQDLPAIYMTSCK